MSSNSSFALPCEYSSGSDTLAGRLSENEVIFERPLEERDPKTIMGNKQIEVLRNGETKAELQYSTNGAVLSVDFMYTHTNSRDKGYQKILSKYLLDKYKVKEIKSYLVSDNLLPILESFKKGHGFYAGLKNTSFYKIFGDHFGYIKINMQTRMKFLQLELILDMSPDISAEALRKEIEDSGGLLIVLEKP